MDLRPFFPAAALVSLGLAGCSGNLTASGGPSQANPLDSEESAAVSELNQVRATHSPPAPPVTVCFSLDVSASGHSDDMRDHPSLPLGETGSNGTDVRSRACAAGYKAACPGNPSGSPSMAEVVAEGNSTGVATLQQWAADPTSGPLIVDPSFVVVGIGRSMSVTAYYWTLDLASMHDASCSM